MAELLRCPYCRDGLGPRAEAIQCSGCSTPHHKSCWEELLGKCTTSGCASPGAVPFTRRAAAKVVIGAGKAAAAERVGKARKRLGGTGAILAFGLTLASIGVPFGAVVYGLKLERDVAIAVTLAGLFVFMTLWMFGLLASGYVLQDDLEIELADDDVDSYRFSGGDIDTSRNSYDTYSSSSADSLEGFLGELLFMLVAAVFVFAVLPVIAWVVFELLLPGLVIAVYSILYWGLSGAATAKVDLRGRPVMCFLRAAMLAGLYTVVIGGVIYGGLALHAALRA